MKNALTPRTILIRTAAVAFILTGFTIGAVPADALGVGVGTGGTVNTPLVSGGVNTTTTTGVDNLGRPVNTKPAMVNRAQGTTTTSPDITGTSTNSPGTINGTMQQDNQQLRSDTNANLRSDTKALNNSPDVTSDVKTNTSVTGGVNGSGATLGAGTKTNTNPSTIGTTKY